MFCCQSWLTAVRGSGRQYDARGLLEFQPAHTFRENFRCCADCKFHVDFLLTIMSLMETEYTKSCLIGGLPSHFLRHHSQNFFFECNQQAEVLAHVDGSGRGAVKTARSRPHSFGRN
jgi:hypothetical protein